MQRFNGRATKKAARIVVLATLAAALTEPSLAQTDRADRDHRTARTIVVCLPDRKLAVMEDGDVIATFPVAVGAIASPSPTGEFQIVSRVSHPTYYRPGTVIPSGKDNPVGTRWLGLSQKGYGIHGTNAPRSVGHAASHGCIRLRNRDMERLFTMVRVGDAVQIRGERDEETAQIFGGEGDPDEAATSAADQLGGR